MKYSISKIDLLFDLIMYSIIQWILISGLASNKPGLIGYFFLMLSMLIYLKIFLDIKKLTNSKLKSILLLLSCIIITFMCAFIWGYFEIKLVSF